jgi:hypothetical protein
MRSMMKGLVVASVGFAMFAMPAAAADYEDDMREMREMVLKLQDRVEAQQGRIDDQEGVIREAGLEEERGSASMISSFLESTDFSGWVSASYFYNTNNPRNPSAGGNATNSNPFHPDHNSFQFDEAWFVMDRAATEESPAGFHFEILYGATASAIQSGSAHLNGNDFWIPSANVSYMTPWGQTLTAGKFGTTVGYEVAGAPSNVNITRGFIYNLFQPISHTGLTVSQDFDNGMTYTVGITNGFGTDQPDTNNGKGFLWQVGWGNDTMTFLFNGVYDDNWEDGGSVVGPTDSRYVLDLVAEMTPADNVLVWANADYIETDTPGADPNGFGISVGTRVGVTDDMGVGGRFEFGTFDNDGNASFMDGELYSITGTIDYALTDNLTWKSEAKWEGSDNMKHAYRKGSNSTTDGAVYLGTQLYYEF